ncbi:uncharacterized protein LOC104454180 isoform X1 [Eucalyptus grandis]|uniref:uncharacterized protein LOC104454180 isoform X1 n=1 Tax=Eucalyptus grandis TaxID=71139 RepID=UPI00192EBA9B|nr:uncharacterized protein LOC104454180 isoform X1 [Eucalyptus grandis]
MSTCRFLLSNGVISQSSDAPTVASFLETHPGAYTTTRTHNDGSCILFWGRHLNRLINSAKILLNSEPRFLFGSSWPVDASSASSMALSVWEPGIPDLVNESTRKVLPRAMRDREMGQELAITVLLSGNLESLRKSVHVGRKRVDCVLDVHVHVSAYVPPVFGAGQSGARLALVGRGRSVAAAKYSDWVRLRKPLEQLRPPSVTELLLSDDGDHILEGTITNFFIVCRKDNGEDNGKGVHSGTNVYSSLEVQTAPVSDGVLPGVLRQLVIEVCLSKGIPFREVAPSWSMHGLWEEAFITNGLRLLQHVDAILVPSEYASLESRTYKEVSWKEKQFQDGPGMITRMIQDQKEIMEKAMLEGHLLDSS